MSSIQESPRIGFLGAGKMATALAKGWLDAGLVTPDRLTASDPAAAARNIFQEATAVAGADDNLAVVTQSDVLVLAVKPQQVAEVLHQLAPRITTNHLIISIAAGVPIKRVADLLGFDRRIIRVMPNTPCLVGACASAYAAGTHVLPGDLAFVDRLLSAVGRTFLVPEKLLDAVTGLSGSGPAYVFMVIEALSDGGVRMGLSREVASVLAAQTVFGAAKLVLETGLHPAVLKDMVTSPGGTTIAGLHALEDGAVRAAFIDAVEAATERSEELGLG